MAGVRYKDSEGTVREATAALTLVCDGMYSSLRSKLSVPKIDHPSYFVGLLLRGCSLPWANYGHVVLARPSPILFYPISSTEVRPTSFHTRISCVYSMAKSYLRSCRCDVLLLIIELDS